MRNSLWVMWLAVAVSGCFPAPSPMRSLKYELAPEPRCLVVMFPGAGDTAEAFETQGFVQRLRDAKLSVDVVAANATLGYYFKGTMRERAHDDVIAPARKKKAYPKTWLMGPSMGGFGSLFYAQTHPEEVDGVIAFAPYLGRRALGEEIRNAGGLAKWKAPLIEPSDEDNYQEQLWRWLQQVTTGVTKGPSLYVGWGTEDSLAPMDQLLADALPKDHVRTTKGPHDWPPWNEILEQYVQDSDFARDCGPAPAAPADAGVPTEP